MIETKAYFYGGRYDGLVVTIDELENMDYDGRTEDLSYARSRGAWVHRAELDDKPTFDDYAGPMWDDGQLRYETWDLYEIMSE